MLCWWVYAGCMPDRAYAPVEGSFNQEDGRRAAPTVLQELAGTLGAQGRLSRERSEHSWLHIWQGRTLCNSCRLSIESTSLLARLEARRESVTFGLVFTCAARIPGSLNGCECGTESQSES